jgi:hypothetical protein
MQSREHLTDVRQQPGAVAVVNDPERVLVPGAEESDELLVRAEPEKRGSQPDATPS